MGIAQYLDRELIAFPDLDTRNEIIHALITRAKKGKWIGDAEKFEKAILRREQIVSTGIGVGVAVPHAKLDTCEQFFIIIAILKQGVEWQALDDQKVRLVFLIGGPDDKPTEYLQILSQLTLLMKDEERRKRLLNETDPESVLALFKGL